MKINVLWRVARQPYGAFTVIIHDEETIIIQKGFARKLTSEKLKIEYNTCGIFRNHETKNL